METITSPCLDGRFRSSTYVPLDADREHLIKFIEHEMVARRQYEQEILDLRAQLAMLEEKIRGTEINISSCRSALSTQRRLPVELWRTIFSILCLKLHEYTFAINFDTSDGCLDSDTPIFEKPAIDLSQVCRLWRNIITNEPTFWSSVSVELNCLPYDVSIPLTIHDNNARGHPPRISVVSIEEFPSKRHGLAAWAILSAHIPRCRELDVWAEHLDFPSIPDLNFPNLETYIEQSFFKLRPNAPFRIFHAIQNAAPKLSKVSVWGLRPEIPYTQLTSLVLRNVHGPKLSVLLRLLPTCTLLESLTLRGMDSNRLDSFTLETVLPSLTKLSIDQDNWTLQSNNPIFPMLFTSLKLPALQSFELRCEGWPPSLPLLFQSSPDTLERLHIRLSSFGASNPTTHPLLPMLASFPNLTYLRLELGWSKWSGACPLLFFSTFLSKLRVDNHERPPFLPKLTSLLLALMHLRPGDKIVDQVFDVVSSRNPLSMRTESPSSSNLTPLKDIHLGVCVPLVWRGDGPNVVLGPAVERRVQEFERKHRVSIVIGGIEED